MGKTPKMLTPRQYAEAKGAAYTTVMNWLQQGRIPTAVKRETPSGHYWEVPEAAPVPNLQPGRPRKEAAAIPAKKGRKKGAK